jgi:hypothetical protein
MQMNLAVPTRALVLGCLRLHSCRHIFPLFHLIRRLKKLPTVPLDALILGMY